MIDDSRIGIYRYLEGLLVESVTENVYLMEEPQELTQSDTEEGFVVVQVGEFNDASEFDCEAYGWARAYIKVYVPPITRGRLNVAKYEAFEASINSVIKDATESDDVNYWIQSDNTLSLDLTTETNANNTYYIFVKSFVVVVDDDISINTSNQ